MVYNMLLLYKYFPFSRKKFESLGFSSHLCIVKQKELLMYLDSLHINSIDVFDDYANVVGKFCFLRQYDVLFSIEDYISSCLVDFLDLDVDGEDYCFVDLALSNSRKRWYLSFRVNVKVMPNRKCHFEFVYIA